MSNNDGIFSIICANRAPNQDFNEVARALIVREVETGRTYRDVAAEAKCSPATIFNIYQRWKTQRLPWALGSASNAGAAGEVTRRANGRGLLLLLLLLLLKQSVSSGLLAV